MVSVLFHEVAHLPIFPMLRLANLSPMLQPSRPTTPYAIPPTQPLSEATLNQTPALGLVAHQAMATT